MTESEQKRALTPEQIEELMERMKARGAPHLSAAERAEMSKIGLYVRRDLRERLDVVAALFSESRSKLGAFALAAGLTQLEDELIRGFDEEWGKDE